MEPLYTAMVAANAAAPSDAVPGGQDIVCVGVCVREGWAVRTSRSSESVPQCSSRSNSSSFTVHFG